MSVKVKNKREAQPSEQENAANGTQQEAPQNPSLVTVKSKDGKAAAVSNAIYEEATKEIVALSENDSLARKVDNGPLGEARGKDTWALHAMLRALDQLNANLERQASALRTATATLEEHLQADTQSVTSLVTANKNASEGILDQLQTHIDRRVHELREETHRLIDKRFNQTDMSFAAVRADQEIVKALITDIITDRIGRQTRVR